MGPFVTPIVLILGKYALDKGVELGKEVGPKALETAKEMFGMVLQRVKQVDPRTAQKYPENPKGYTAPMTDALSEILQAEPDFAAKLKELLTKYDTAAKEHATATGKSYQAILTGSGAVAQDGSVAAGAGGVAVGGNVEGGIRLGGRQPDKDEEERE
jgi:hypothetical protein